MIAEVQQALCLSHAAREWLPRARTGNPLHPSVLTRWSDRGILVNGQRVFLHTWRVGGQRMTSKEAIEEFLSALNSSNPSHQSQQADDTTRRGREACSALEKLGC